MTCVEAGPAPCAQALGVDVARSLLPWWRDVDILLDTPVEAVVPGGVMLRDGRELPADVVVTGVGVRPTTDGWSTRAQARRGVVVDEHLRTSDPDIVAVGDVAARWSPRWQAHVHVEHWDEAVTAPTAAARTLLHDPSSDELAPHDPIPYFWSDQFGHKVQYVGHHTADDTIVWRDPDDGTGRAVAGPRRMDASPQCSPSTAPRSWFRRVVPSPQEQRRIRSGWRTRRSRTSTPQPAPRVKSFSTRGCERRYSQPGSVVAPPSAAIDRAMM